MEKKISFFLLVQFFACTLRAQVYTQGDITVTLQPSGFHDSIHCRSEGQMVYDIVIQNSFVGDSVVVYNADRGQILFEAENTTGQNPWNLSPEVFNFYTIADLNQIGGLVELNYDATKVFSGSDSIVYIFNTYHLPVSNPCDYDSITGRVYADYNGNCTFDSSDAPLHGISVGAYGFMEKIGHFYWILAMGTRTDSTGYYDMMMPITWLEHYKVHLDNYFRFIFPSSGCSSWTKDSLTVMPGHDIDFALQCSDNSDVQTFACAPFFARPLIPFILNPRVVNIGCNAVSGDLHLVLDSRVTYSAALSPNPASAVHGDTLIWNYVNLSNLTSNGYWNSFWAGVHLTPGISVNISDTLCFQVFAQPPANDINTANNYASFCIPVINSFDPNMKEVLPQGEGAEGFIPASAKELIYTVHFQNTGNAPALTVVVQDSLEGNIIPGSLQILGASHSMSVNWQEDNNVSFHFSNINLPDSASNEPASHGSVKFKVKLKPGLAPGTEIKNQARIYFDTNPPIYTNTTSILLKYPRLQSS